MHRKYIHQLFWDLYSVKMRKKISHPQHAGKCSGEDFFHEKLSVAYKIELFYDSTAEMFTGMKYMVTAGTFMTALLEGLAECILQKKVSTVVHLRASDILDMLQVYEIANLYDDDIMEDYIRFLSPYVNHVVESFGFIAEKLVPNTFTTPEGLSNFEVEGEGISNFYELRKEIQIAHIERVIEKDIRPYVELDDGGVKVKDLTKSGIVLIEYEGNCTSCHAAGSTTLSAITSILKAKIHNTIEVLPFIG
jgi:NifU-like protein